MAAEFFCRRELCTRLGRLGKQFLIGGYRA